jgi:hypothetical protein
MMGFDQVRAGGEGLVSTSLDVPRKKKKTKPTDQDISQPEIFQGNDQELQVKVPEGWRARK